MSQTSQLSPELARGVLQLARALMAASRNCTLYPPEHPAVGQSLARLSEAVRETSNGAIFSIGITPDTLLIEGAPADRTQPAIAEAAAFLHDRDLLRITLVGTIPAEALLALLRMFTLDAAERRRRGGPAQIWVSDGDPSIVLEQVDYGQLLQREEGDGPAAASRDDVWRSIVLAISTGRQGAFDELSQQRLLAIAGDTVEIAGLATAVMAPKRAMDGSPMITSLAATVLAAFRHLTNIVSVSSPDRMPEVMTNLATAATSLDPHVVMHVLQTEEDPNVQLSVVRGMSAAFDDTKVAQLLATAMALDGQASDRLATIFNTIAPDEDRKRRVMTLTRSMLSETDFGRSGQFQVLWTSMEELLVSYNDKPFVSESYRASLDGMGARAERLAATDLPPELSAWMDTLGQENVRTLSVTLLIDLLSLEEDNARGSDLAHDMEALAEDLLMSGAYADATVVTSALAERAARAGAVGRDGCRLALDQLGESLAMRETVSIIGDVDDQAWQAIRELITRVGPSTIDALKAVMLVENDTTASTRAADLIVAFGRPGVSRLATLVSDPRWFVQRTGARLLGRIAAPEGVPLLQPLVRKPDPRVAREAISALGNIDDPSAARAIHMVLRAASGELRGVVVDALVADRDPRVVPMLARILDESEALGKDHEVVLETLSALAKIPGDAAIPALVKTVGCRGFFGRAKRRAVKERGVAALAAIGSPKAAAALEELSRTGDRMLRKAVTQRHG
jgi:HEAT repeat protein